MQTCGLNILVHRIRSGCPDATAGPNAALWYCKKGRFAEQSGGKHDCNDGKDSTDVAKLHAEFGATSVSRRRIMGCVAHVAHDSPAAYVSLAVLCALHLPGLTAPVHQH